MTTTPDFRVPPVDAVALETRAAELATRSIKKDSKRRGLELIAAMIDLTTLEGMDSPGKVRSLCRKAVRPLPGVDAFPSVAAVCVYPDLVATAVDAVAGSSVQVASVATAFPSGQAPLATRLEEVRRAVADDADEIDMVISRGLLLAGRESAVREEIVETRLA